MAAMAEKLWQVAGPAVLEQLKENVGYDFVITGHSLGAGTAALLNIMCHENDRSLVGGRRVECFTFAASPVFEPLEAAPQAVQATTNYVHGYDVVPFLSVDSVRHTLACFASIAEKCETLDWRSRLRLAVGYTEPDQDLMDHIVEASQRRLPPKEGAPVLFIPAANNVWVRPVSEGVYAIGWF